MDTIPKINRELTNKKLQITVSQKSDLIFGSGKLAAELIIRQYILLRFAGINLNKALLEVFGKYKSKLVYPLPAEWINTIESNGVPVSKFMSHFLWYIKILIYWCYGSLNIAYTFYFRYETY
ncbi:polysaccharide biosynthesis PFTS motif protein [Leptospira interrogans serovar Australis str. 200703203]|uniref:Polysaccharide biosynthesis PFTS motif protein n=1 Tax=Leptospira interrogans serovar Australis str. 200703203 TaxID=1085541 RepID=N1UPT0_LEPIR|nr:polysaccharide biosynthesis PFTS motif protein [Leptospira interrogans serovar Australis str. 200703203]